MEEKDKAKERRVQAYLNPRLDILFKCYCSANKVGDSHAVNDIFRHFFNNISPAQMNLWIAQSKLNEKK